MALENLYPRRLTVIKHNREKSVKGAFGTACGGSALELIFPAMLRNNWRRGI